MVALEAKGRSAATIVSSMMTISATGTYDLVYGVQKERVGREEKRSFQWDAGTVYTTYTTWRVAGRSQWHAAIGCDISRIYYVDAVQSPELAELLT